MTPAPGWLWQVKCVGGSVWQADKRWTGRQRSLAGWLASSGGDKQASKQRSGGREQRALLTLTTEPKRRSLKIWVGMQAELERACVVGRWVTACSTSPLGCVGYRQSAWAGLVGSRVVCRDHCCLYTGTLLACWLVLQATSRGVRRASHEHASHGPAWMVEREGV